MRTAIKPRISLGLAIRRMRLSAPMQRAPCSLFSDFAVRQGSKLVDTELLRCRTGKQRKSMPVPPEALYVPGCSGCFRDSQGLPAARARLSDAALANHQATLRRGLGGRGRRIDRHGIDQRSDRQRPMAHLHDMDNNP